MECLEFLTRVLPDQTHGGYVGTYKRKTGGMWNEGFSTIEELAANSLEASRNGTTAYYALGTFTNNYGPNKDGKDIWQRKGHQAVAFKTLAFDVDCGPDKPYADARAGSAALVQFLKNSSMPVPMIVSSGYGLHCYWPLDKAIVKSQWVELSMGLRALCEHHKFEIDWSKVHDATMVLRPVGTNNFKGQKPAPVKLLRDSPNFTVSELTALIGTQTHIAGPKPRALPVKQSALVEALLEGPKYPPADPRKIIQNCYHVHMLSKDGGAAASEPEWYMLLGVASACREPEKTAIEWSRGHPTFSETSTLNKLDQWRANTTGPSTCAQFDKLNPGHCGKCPFNGVIVSPAALGAPRPEKRAEPPPDDTRPVPFAEPPEQFTRADSGVYTQIGGIPVQICNYDLFPVQIIRDPSNTYDESLWLWEKPHTGYTKVRVRNSYIFAEKTTDLAACLSDNGIYLMSKQQRDYLGGYMRAYMQKLQQAQASGELHDSFGWKNNYQSFVLGSTEFRMQGDQVVATEIGISKVLTNKGLDKSYQTRGDFELWRTWTRALAHPSMAGHAFVLGGAFAAPLVALTGLSGSLVSLLGEGGEGKSTIIEWINSVYGDQNSLGMGKGTQMSYAERMGMVCHLPVTIDEVTLMAPDQASDLAYWSTQGRDKSRKTEAIPRTWALPAFVTTNKSFREKGLHGGEGEAVSLRILEFTFGPNVLFVGENNKGEQTRRVIWNNYGHAGRHYIAGLVKLGAPALRRRIDENAALIERHYGVKFDSRERYWKMIINLHDLGNKLAREMGLIKYDAEPATQWALNNLNFQRTQISNGLMDTFDLLAEYLNENNGASLTIFYNTTRAIVQDPLPRGEVRIRKEIYLDSKGKPERGFMFFDKFHFQKWLVANGYDMKRIIETIVEEDAEFRPNRTGKIYMGKDTPMKLGQVRVVGLNLAHPKLHGMLEQEDDLALLPTNERKNVVAMVR